jgi:prepilin-type N-terminal cleavage/methylation domain-containing protein
MSMESGIENSNSTNKTPPRIPRGKSRVRSRGFTLTEIMIVFGIFSIILAIAVPTWLRQRENSRSSACQENLAKIDGAKEIYAYEHRLTNGASIQMSDLVEPDRSGYLRYEPHCPAGGVYALNPIGTAPSCSYYGYELYGAPKHLAP